MSIFKITSLTNSGNKRESKYNTSLNIDYIDNMQKKTIVLKPGGVIYLSISSLPISIHKLRVRNLIIVDEISSNELSEVFNGEKVENLNTKEESISTEFLDDTKKNKKTKI